MITLSPPTPIKLPGRPKNSLMAFATNLADVIRSSPNDANVALQIKNLLGNLINTDTFVLDCIDQAMSAMVPPFSSWTNPPIFDDDELECSIRLIYWPPHYSNSPHEHTCWTITGVLSNELTFTIYRRNTALSGLEFAVDRELLGRPGEVGYILPPCIHRVSNHSDSPSISLHVFSGPKVEVASAFGEVYMRGQTIWYGSEVTRELPLVFTLNYALQALIILLDSIISERSLDLLDRIFQFADLSSRLACAKAIGRQDPIRAGHRLLELANLCCDEDAIRLRTIAASLLHIKPEN